MTYRFTPAHALYRILFAAVIALVCAAPHAVFAQSCSFTVSSLAFGNVSTISGSPTDTTGIVTANCTGFTSSSVVRLCLNLGSPTGAWNPRTMAGPSGSSLTFNIYTDVARTTIWGSWTAGSYPPGIIDLPVVNGSASSTFTMYGRINAGQSSARVGSYVSSYGTGDVQFVYLGYTTTPPTCTNVQSPAQRPTFSVTATVAADCNITAAPLAFPAVSALTNQVTATTTLTVTCVSNAPYTVALDAGTAVGATVANRLMQLDGGSATVRYGLYKDAAMSQPWGDGTAGTATGSGTGTGIAQSLAVYGRVPAQTIPPPGNYSDTVTATVSF